MYFKILQLENMLHIFKPCFWKLSNSLRRLILQICVLTRVINVKFFRETVSKDTIIFYHIPFKLTVAINVCEYALINDAQSIIKIAMAVIKLRGDIYDFEVKKLDMLENE